MLTRLRLRNFRCYRDSDEIPLRPLTIIVGANNSGKSTILNALLLLKQTLQDQDTAEPLVTSGPAVDLGGYFDILRGGLRAKHPRVGIEVGMRPVGTRTSLLTRGMLRAGHRSREASFEVTFSFARREGRVQVSSFEQRRGDRVVLSWKKSEGLRFDAPLPKVLVGQIRTQFSHFFPMVYPSRRASSSRAGRTIRSLWSKTFDNHWDWSATFADVHHVEPIRPEIPRFGMLGRVATAEAGAGGEDLIRALRDPSPVGDMHSDLLTLVDLWMSKRFGMLSRLRLKYLDKRRTVLELLANEPTGYRNINLANMGKGIAQVLPIVSEVQKGERGDVVLVEQPEVHLHPDAQANLGDLFVDAVRSMRTRQVIVETHSEHLLLRVRRLVAQRRLPPEMVSVLFVERRGSESRVRRLDLDSKGQFSDWPKGFFEQGYVESLRLAEAIDSHG